jgi:breast cancer 2 susceptibility protein
MVLCVSDIIWPAGGSEEDTAPVQTYPGLEVTDGWYRIRAQIDAPLARGVRKGKIKIGRKIAVAGAKVSSALLDDTPAPFNRL